MVQLVSPVYQVASGQPVYGGRFPVPVAAFSLTTDPAEYNGGASMVPAVAAFNLSTDAATFSGSAMGSLVPSGSIVNLGATNRISNIDPAADVLANPNYAGTPPWDAPSGGDWTSVLDYCGAVFVPTVGTAGTWMFYGSAGHSAIGATAWFGYDVAAKQFLRIGPVPLPSNALYGFVDGSNPDPAAFDFTWGDWDPNWSGFPAGFRQPGRSRVLEGSHTRTRMQFIPASVVGNTKGAILVAWRVTGVNDTAGSMGASHWYNLDTHNWTRTSNARPGIGGANGPLIYHAASGVAVCNSATVGGSSNNALDVLDLSTMTWTHRTFLSGGFFVFAEAGGFSWTDGAGKEWHVETSGQTAYPFGCGMKVETLISGTGMAWTELQVTYATTQPVNGSGSLESVNWVRCPVDGCYYTVNRIGGSNKLWKLTPPVSGVFADMWNVTEQTLSGSLQASDFVYTRLQWCPPLSAFLWHGPDVTADMQAIRPVGI